MGVLEFSVWEVLRNQTPVNTDGFLLLDKLYFTKKNQHSERSNSFVSSYNIWQPPRVFIFIDKKQY